MNLKGTSIIGTQSGEETSKYSYAFNPATGEQLEPKFFEATRDEVAKAAELAAEAFIEYRDTSFEKRAAFLRAIADNINTARDAISYRATMETGLPEGRISLETDRTINQLRLFADLVEEGSWVDARIDKANPNRIPVAKPDTRSMLKPLGPVAVFCASNFPLAFSVAGGDTASALAAGCPVIVKAHGGHPGTSEIVALTIAAAAMKCGMPDGVFSLLYGKGKVVGRALVEHPAVKAVGFTGSREGGLSLMEVAEAREEPIPVYAEMSSVNPVILLPGVLESRPEDVANGLHMSVTLGAGQFCTNPGLILAPPHKFFRETFVKLLTGSPPSCMLHAGILKSYESGLDARENSAAAKLYRGENHLKEGGPALAEGALFEVDAEEFLKDPSLREEIFGPTTLILTYTDVEQLRDVVKSLEGQLTATIHGTKNDLEDYKPLIDLLETKVGRLVFNGYPTGVEVCHSMVHGGPFPATSDGKSTSVGTAAIYRFTRAVCYQNFPENALPDALKEENPLGIQRLIDGVRTRDPKS